MLLMNNRATLRTHAPCSSASPHATGTSRSLLPVRPLSLQRRRPLHVVRFKEGDKMQEEKPTDQLTPPPTTDASQDGSSGSSLQPGHRDPIKRSRDALTQLLGRRSSSNSDNASSTSSSRQHRSSRTPAFEAPLNTPVFSRKREVLVGRVAMAAFYATCQWEVLTGMGPVSQASVSTGLPCFIVQALLAAFVLHGLYGFSPSTPTWSAHNRDDLLRRPRGVPRAFINPIKEPARFFGFSEWGFTKANEVFAGRLAMLGWFGVALVEPWSGGKGPLGQVAWWLHLPTFPAYYQFAGLLLVALPIVFGALAYINKRPGQVAGGDDIY